MKKYTYYMFIISLVMIVFGVFLITPDNNMKKVDMSMSTKSLKSNVVNTVSIKKILAEKKKEAERKAKIQARKLTEDIKLESKKVNAKTLKSGTGRVSYYGLNCAGCSGRVGAGKALKGVYYNDPKFGYVRALAAGREYSYGTIIRISGTPLGTFTGIVLDRGGNIGAGRRFMFDVLVPSEAVAYKYGVSSIKYQVLRYGY